MGNARHSSGLNVSRRAELEARFRALDGLILRQKQAVKEIGQNGASLAPAVTVLRLLEREQSVVLEELGYNPRAN